MNMLPPFRIELIVACCIVFFMANDKVRNLDCVVVVVNLVECVVELVENVDTLMESVDKLFVLMHEIRNDRTLVNNLDGVPVNMVDS